MLEVLVLSFGTVGRVSRATFVKVVSAAKAKSGPDFVQGIHRQYSLYY